MKSKVRIIFFLVVAVFCGVAWIQSRQNQALEAEVTALRQRLEERTRERQADEALKQELTEQQEKLNQEVQQLTQQLATLRAEAATKSGSAQPGATSAAGAHDPQPVSATAFRRPERPL